MEIYDITIIGAGPVGMFAAFYGTNPKTNIFYHLHFTNSFL
ncbi:hypothetical protein [Enterococcus faecium]|nr:hypothetical protein [Enterococcus faecium]